MPSTSGSQVSRHQDPCVQLIQRLLAIHGDDSLLHERCTLYLERIAFVSDRCKDVHEEEKERMKDDDNVTNHLAFPKANKKEREKKKKKQHKEGSAELLKKVKKEKKKKKKEKRKDTNSSPSSLHEDGVQENKESRSNTPRMPIAARLDDVRPYLDFTEFLYADSPALFDESSPDDEFYVAFKLFGDLFASPSAFTNVSNGLIHYYPPRENGLNHLSPLPEAAPREERSSSGAPTLITGPSDPFAVFATHVIQPDLHRVTLRFEVVNVTMRAMENVKLSLGTTGHVTSSEASPQTHKVISKAEPDERIAWEVDFIFHSFCQASFQLQVSVPFEKEPIFLVIQGGRGGIGGGGDMSNSEGMMYRILRCQPYTIPAHQLLLHRPYAVHEFRSLWNRFGASRTIEVRFKPGVDFDTIVSAFSSTLFVPVIKSNNPETLHMALCGCSWFGEQLFFTISAAVGARGVVEAVIEYRASSPVALWHFAGMMEIDWLSSLFISWTTRSPPSPVQRTPLERIHGGEGSVFSHHLSTPQLPSSLFSSFSQLPLSLLQPTATNAASLPSTPTTVIGSSLLAGSTVNDMESSSSSLPFNVLLQSQVSDSSKTILTRWTDMSSKSS